LDIANTPVFASLNGMFRPTKPLPLAEFIVMLAFMVSIVAMSTDIMLPVTCCHEKAVVDKASWPSRQSGVMLRGEERAE
jgi:hypothetical protein